MVPVFMTHLVTPEQSVHAHEAFDRELALLRLDDDPGLLAELVQLFFDESPRMLFNINEALVHADMPALERAAHFVKGSVAIFAAQDTCDAALRLESIARSGALTGLAEACEAVVVEMGRLGLALEQWRAGYVQGAFTSPSTT